MEANETIEHTLEVIKNLPVDAQKEVSQFAEKILAQLEDKEFGTWNDGITKPLTSGF